MAEQELVHSLPANWKGDEVRFTYNKTNNGTVLIHVRTWYVDQVSGEYRPSKQGVTISLVNWPSFLQGVEAMNKKLEE